MDLYEVRYRVTMGTKKLEKKAYVTAASSQEVETKARKLAHKRASAIEILEVKKL